MKKQTKGIGNSMRKYSECKWFMWEGFCIENGCEYYCSEECLEKNITLEDFLLLYNDGEGDSYWTQWDDDEI